MKLAPFLLVASLSCLGLVAAEPTDVPSLPASESGSAIIASGKGFTVKQVELDATFAELEKAYASRGQTVPDGERETIRYRLLERLVATKLLAHVATDEDRAAARERLEKFMAQTLAKFPSPEAFDRQLKQAGMSPEQFKSSTLDQFVRETVLERNLRPLFTVDEAAIKKFYDENPSNFEKPETVRASHILVATLDASKTPAEPYPDEVKAQKLAKAKSIRDRAVKGEDFAALAKEFSEDPASKDRGGEYTFPRGKMVKPFEDAAFSLKPGEISEVVETPFGYHVIKLSEKMPAEIVPLERVHDDLKKALETQEIQKRVPEFVEKLKQENDVVIKLPKPEPAKEESKN